MATQRLNLPSDGSSLSNYITWGKAIEDFFISCGWVKTSDTGQTQWATVTCSITNAVASGGYATYTFSGATASLRNGMSITVAGCTTVAFNITGAIVNLSGTTSGTFQLALAGTIASEAETATGTVSAVAAIPTNTYNYCIYAATDSLAATYPIYVKIETSVQNTGSWYNGGVRVTMGRGSNGSGSLTTATSAITASATWGNPSGGTFDTLMSGDSGRMQICLWRGNPSGCNPFISIERSCDSSGTPNSDFIYLSAAYNSTNTASTFASQVITGTGATGAQHAYLETHSNNDLSTQSGSYIGLFPARPVLGKECNPLLGMIRGALNDWTDGDIFSVAVYPGGTSHTYIALKAGNAYAYKAFGPVVGGNNCVLMRWE